VFKSKKPNVVKDLFYQALAGLVQAASWCAFRRLELRGLDRVPWQKPCVVSPNHQNAFLDALLIGAHAPVKMTYLTRASVFGSRFDWFLDALQMEPIYRRRDGFGTLSRNEEIFARQREKLRDGRSLLMFSEKEHALTYHLRPITRGSSRFALRTQAAIDREVQLVPVGINYYHHQRPGFKVSVVFGEPLPVAQYMERYRAHEAKGINALRDDLTAAMKDCLLVPDKTDDYRERIDRINRKNEGLPFPEMKRALRQPETLAPKGAHRPALDTLAQWVDVLNAGPLWVANELRRRIDEPAFALSLKFAVGMLVCPVWWLLLFGLGTAVAGPAVGGAVAALAVGTMGLRLLLVRWSNPPHPVD
jgi:1-acyl-sn-glycerol-3-phosphate acyltransferase